MKKKLLLLILASCFLVNCSAIKRLKTVTQGEVKQDQYFEEIPFRYVKNQIILDVYIDGKNYPFIFDTGNDITMIDYSIIESINLKSNNVNGDISDVNGISKESTYYTIADLKIGNINFLNTGAYTSDLSYLYQFLGKDNYVGIIGSNLMRKAKWQIDYKNKILRIANNIDAFHISPNAYNFNTKSGKYGDAEIKIKLNTFEDLFTFDTGYSGNISTKTATLNTLNTIPYISATGVNSIGANGILTSTDYSALLDLELLDNLKIKDQLVTFSENGSNIIGNTFFEHFTVTLDWSNEVFYLDQNKPIKANIISEYQVLFHPNYLTNKIIVYGYKNDYPLENPIEIGTQILTINGVNVSGLNTEALYNYWTKKDLPDTFSIEVEDHENIRSITLTKKQLLPMQQ
ncbi:retropepsin-like aspartic protease [uncultured Formosa sp.]|uniref:retropepsin-like aspartic protease n=1 Tax=uncultured Formosa sp. TaxID=255435 RepID=UPI0026373FFD|nr:retropepsin-like aspartic protease [uncultured Formosa sp.]